MTADSMASHVLGLQNNDLLLQRITGDATQQLFWVYSETGADAVKHTGPNHLQTTQLYSQ